MENWPFIHLLVSEKLQKWRFINIVKLIKKTGLTQVHRVFLNVSVTNAIIGPTPLIRRRRDMNSAEKTRYLNVTWDNNKRNTIQITIFIRDGPGK